MTTILLSSLPWSSRVALCQGGCQGPHRDLGREQGGNAETAAANGL